MYGTGEKHTEREDKCKLQRGGNTGIEIASLPAGARNERVRTKAMTKKDRFPLPVFTEPALMKMGVQVS